MIFYYKYNYSVQKVIKLIALFLLTILSQNNIEAQDISFSQVYAYPLYLNPSLTGTSECPRITTGYQKSFSSFSDDFFSGIVAFDLYIKSIHGGVGLVTNYNKEGYFTRLNLGFMYAYHITLARKLRASFALVVGIQQNKIDWDNLTFGDMVDPIQGFVLPSNENVPTDLQKIFPDFSMGISFFYLKSYYFGVSIHHLNQPDVSYLNNGSSYLYRKYTLSAGSKITLNGLSDGKLSISPNIIYQQQNKSQYLNAGMYLNVNYFTLGGWYRHNFSGHSVVVLLLGLKYKKIKIGYSYETSFSKVKSIRDGTHEISLQLDFNCFESNKPKKEKYECPSW